MTKDVMADGREADLHAYIDNELDPEQRIAFEAYLAANPAVAARVHEYLHQREALRRGLDLLVATEPPGTADLAGRLYRRLRLDLTLRRFGPIAAAVLLLAGGWNVGAWVQQQSGAGWAAVPPFAGEAAAAHATAVAQTVAQPAIAPQDLKAVAEGLARRVGETAINLPEADPNLTLVKAGVVPWHEGAALQFVYRETDGELLTLLVVVGDPVNDAGLHAVEQNGLQLVYWGKGSVVYTVAGSRTDSDVLVVAKRMADSVRRS